MDYFVFGGAGYVGSFLAYDSDPKVSDELVVVDNFSTGNHFATAGKNLETIDLLDAAALRGAFERYRVNGVFHFAAKSLVAESAEWPLDYYRNNVVGTLNLIEACKQSGVKKIVFSSTAAVYGIPEQLPINEATPTQPINVYGRSKLFAEQMLHDAFAAHGISSVCLRYFNAAGAAPDGSLGEAHEPETHLIAIILRKLMFGDNKVKIFGDDYPTDDGTCVRDYIHVRDLADAHWRAMHWLDDNPGAHKFNLGTGQGYSVRQVMEACERVTGRKLDVEIAPRREGDPAILVADAGKAHSELGWGPLFSDLETIIGDAWVWHQKHHGG